MTNCGYSEAFSEREFPDGKEEVGFHFLRCGLTKEMESRDATGKLEFNVSGGFGVWCMSKNGDTNYRFIDHELSDEEAGILIEQIEGNGFWLLNTHYLTLMRGRDSDGLARPESWTLPFDIHVKSPCHGQISVELGGRLLREVQVNNHHVVHIIPSPFALEMNLWTCHLVQVLLIQDQMCMCSL